MQPMVIISAFVWSINLKRGHVPKQFVSCFIIELNDSVGGFFVVFEYYRSECYHSIESVLVFIVSNVMCVCVCVQYYCVFLLRGVGWEFSF